MPLDTIARRYADTHLTNATEEAAERMSTDLRKVRSDHSKRNTLISGLYINDVSSVYLDQIRYLADARADSLVKAYEKTGLPFDESAYNEVKTEVMEFCQQKQHNAVNAIGQVIRQTFQGSLPQGLDKASASQIVSGVNGIMARLSRALSIRRDEVLLENMRVKKAYAAGLGKEWDVFISHASEDKEQFVRELAQALEASGLSVWYDEISLRVGDSLRRKIEEGLAKSRYGIVVLSPHFFAKEWPQNELDGLASREVAGNKVILPVWHNIELAEVRGHAPMLSGRIAAKSSDGVENVVRQLRDAMGL